MQESMADRLTEPLSFFLFPFPSSCMLPWLLVRHGRASDKSLFCAPTPMLTANLIPLAVNNQFPDIALHFPPG